ncbi:MAG: polysaccharide deacetylase family protein [Paenibacillus sp.]|jgi:peptidoglycan/xylan/chitin deacetylase (PgdA/CDA1 family)|nr:polysaccharide deacetylase family protein [Paenibacillus sp.]
MAKVMMTFPEGKNKVLTLSYDDGRAADRRLVQLLNTYRIKGTFHLNSGLFSSGDRVPAEEIAGLYEGHEISGHTLTHPTIARSPKEYIVYEMMEDRKGLEQLAGYPVRGLSYPNGSYNKMIKEMLPLLGFEYSRVTESTGAFGLPDDLFHWKPTCHHNKNLLGLAESFIANKRTNVLHMMYVWGHSYEFDNDNSWGMMEQFCQLIADKEDIWYATNIEIVDYMKAFQRLHFSASCDFVYNPSACSVWVNAGGKTVEIPGGRQVSLSVPV